ncbi:MAG: hypothetical protein QOF76_2606 [Solirubrobacteraceae bacterium]|nr:hypothetical protein [Solirubrobacteraceae bacterium]
MAVTTKAHTAAPADTRAKPVLAWAVVGALMLAFQLYVLGRWVFGSNFTSTDAAGPDTVSDTTKAFYVALQAAVTVATVVCLYFWVVRPWRREGRLTTDAMFAMAGAMLFFWDMSMNYTSTALFYNSNFVNFGAWANDAWPGWMSPGANLLPEPVFVAIPGYTCMVFSQALIVLYLLRKAQARWPNLGSFARAGIIICGCFVLDTIIESLLLRMDLYAYPGGIRAITLYAGHTYQLPLTESFFFGGLGVGSVAMLMHFRDDLGRTVVERGIERVRYGERGKQAVRFFAIFGAVHVAFLVLYMVPNQWLSTHSDPYPKGYPSYLENGMCQYGPQHNLCPGPGVAIPREP